MSTGLQTETVVFEVEGFELLIEGTVREWPDGKIAVVGITSDLGLFATHWAESQAERRAEVTMPTMLRDGARLQCYRATWHGNNTPGQIWFTVWKTPGNRTPSRVTAKTSTAALQSLADAMAAFGAAAGPAQEAHRRLWVVARNMQEARHHHAELHSMLVAAGIDTESRQFGAPEIRTRTTSVAFKSIQQGRESFAGATLHGVTCTVSAHRSAVAELALLIAPHSGEIEWMTP